MPLENSKNLFDVIKVIRDAKVLNDDQYRALYAAVFDYEVLRVYGTDVHALAEDQRKKRLAEIKDETEDLTLAKQMPPLLSVAPDLRLFFPNGATIDGTTYNGYWPDGYELIQNRRNAIKEKLNAIYHSVQLIMAFESVSQTKAQKILADKTGRELSDIKSSYSRERKRVAGR